MWRRCRCRCARRTGGRVGATKRLSSRHRRSRRWGRHRSLQLHVSSTLRHAARKEDGGSPGQRAGGQPRQAGVGGAATVHGTGRGPGRGSSTMPSSPVLWMMGACLMSFSVCTLRPFRSFTKMTEEGIFISIITTQASGFRISTNTFPQIHHKSIRF